MEDFNLVIHFSISHPHTFLLMINFNSFKMKTYSNNFIKLFLIKINLNTYIFCKENHGKDQSI